MSLKDDFEELERALLGEVKHFYGSSLVTLAVFGSVGRNAQRYDSDLDILLIASNSRSPFKPAEMKAP